MSKKVEDIYKKVTQVEHILLRPDTYIGSVETTDQELWICDSIDPLSFKFDTFSYCQGLYKIFDEILVNAADNYWRDKNTDKIAVTIDSSTISIENTGAGIPIQIHKEHNIYIPELIFGHLLTSSNYDDKEQKITGGRNGFGAKLTNIFSSYFKVETVEKGKKFSMTWTDNMSKHNDHEITSTNEKSYTKVTFKPDLKKFKVERLSDITPLLFKRVVDLAGILPIQVILNNKKIQLHSFKDYANLYGAGKFVFQNVNKPYKWDVLISASDGQFQQVSFVNSCSTIRGGTHVNYITDQVVEALVNFIKKKHKELKNIKPFQVKSQIKLFLNCQIVNPAFDSQSKETLTTKANQFGSTFVISDKLIDEIIKKTDIIEQVLLQAKSKLNKQLSKQLTGKKQQRLLGIDKLEDANDAGTKFGDQCTLILTEGDSAKSLAMAGIEIVGRDRFGVFPLRGKLLNVRDATITQIMKNAEIEQLVKIVGLQFNKEYENTKSLRYGSIMIMTDQDHDGHHIKGLIINLIEKFWPSLFKLKGFLKQFITPIIKITKVGRNPESHSFFSIGEYKKFIQENSNIEYKVKYYKGLGTSTDAEAQQYFSNLTMHRKLFTYYDQTDCDYVDLAFSKNKADQRKEWLSEYSWKAIEDTLDYSKQSIRYRSFITDCLAMHSISDNLRSIPSGIDGLKPTQRKIIHTLLNHTKQEYKVSSLGGLATTYAQYHHGETSIQQTIVAMAQNFTGSNNINLLMPIGQFGTRSLAGKDAAQARYISTKLSPLSLQIFNEHDLHTLNYLEEEGQNVEPYWFMPIIPLILINGAEGIGTGWSTSIPNFNPREICQQLKKRMRGEQIEELVPWYKGFTGQIQAGINQYILKGSYIVHKNYIYITEIPAKKSIKEYQALLQSKMQTPEGNPDILDLKEYHAGNKVCFEVKVSDSVLKQDIEKYFKLSSTISMTNLVLFNKEGLIKKYQSIKEILEEFYNTRLQFYQLRKEYLLSSYKNQLELVQSKSKFIEGMIDNTLQLRGLKKNEMCEYLKSKGFKGINQISPIQSTKIKSAQATSLEQQFDYLLSMPIWNFSDEKVQQFRQQIKQLNDQINVLQKSTPELLWSEDIDQFLLELNKQEEQESIEMIKRVEKNVEKLMKGGSIYLKGLLNGKQQINIDNDYQSSSEDDDGPIRDPKILKKVIKDFSNFGISSIREQPQQIMKLKNVKNQNQSDNKSDQVDVEIDLDDQLSPNENKSILKEIKKQQEKENENEKQKLKQKSKLIIESDDQINNESSQEEVIKPTKRKQQQITQIEIKSQSEESKGKNSNKQIKKESKLKKNVQKLQQSSSKKEINERAEKEKKKEDLKQAELEKEEMEKQRVPVESLKMSSDQKREQDLFLKYGLGDLMKYLTPSNNKSDNSIPSLNEKAIKSSNINDTQSSSKKQESKSKKKNNKQQEDIEIDISDDNIFNIDLHLDESKKISEKQFSPKQTPAHKPPKVNTPTPQKRKLKKNVIESSESEFEQPKNKKIRKS